MWHVTRGVGERLKECFEKLEPNGMWSLKVLELSVLETFRSFHIVRMLVSITWILIPNLQAPSYLAASQPCRLFRDLGCGDSSCDVTALSGAPSSGRKLRRLSHRAAVRLCAETAELCAGVAGGSSDQLQYQ